MQISPCLPMTRIWNTNNFRFYYGKDLPSRAKHERWRLKQNRVYVGRSIIYLPKQERRQLVDWNKSVRVGTCLEVSHMQPQLSAILSEWQHIKWACLWALSRRVAPSWQRASTHVYKISSCHSAMWVPTTKSPALQSGHSSLGLFPIPSYEKNFFGVNDFQVMKKSRRRSRPGLKSSQKIFFFPRG